MNGQAGAFDGIVLAGGHGRRMGGANKAALDIGGRRLLDVALNALCDAERVIVVGQPLPMAAPVQWAREEPAGGGPVAALATGLALVDSPIVVALACDLPFVDRGHVDQLTARCAAAPPVTGAVAVDADGRDQPLLAAYDTASLRAALPTPAEGASMRTALASLERIGPVARIRLAGGRPATWDCDTPEDLDYAREHA
jgi:molybdopterin-guanine dinucleotide biosynthesis protein A